MQADAQWFANRVAIAAVITSAISLLVAFVAAIYARKQAAAADRQAAAAELQITQAEKAHQLQEDALKAQTADTQRALEIAKQSAEAAERLAKTNEALAITGQRGWLLLFSSNGSVEDRAEFEKLNIRAALQLKNMGRTPVSDVRIGHCQAISAEIPGDCERPTELLRASMAPNDEILLSELIEVNPAQYPRIQSGQLRAYFYGIVTYKDVFGNACSTKWRLYMNLRGPELIPCDFGNELL